MKRILLVLFAFSAFFANAQNWGSNDADSIRCFENYNNFGQLCNGKDYLQAYEPWMIVYTT
ncbi:MAG: hypothetical protein EBZ26_07220, partial [Flavobacteriia bacterium]|nr:hypothetical protein [Flavobacteriia bacterium]